jgi:hypothetical protein
VVNERWEKDENDADGKCLVCLFVWGRSEDAIYTILSIGGVFTIKLLSYHDGDRVIEQSSVRRSDCHPGRELCNGFVLVQQAFSRRGQGEFVATIRVDVHLLIQDYLDGPDHRRLEWYGQSSRNQAGTTRCQCLHCRKEPVQTRPSN